MPGSGLAPKAQCLFETLFRLFPTFWRPVPRRPSSATRAPPTRTRVILGRDRRPLGNVGLRGPFLCGFGKLLRERCERVPHLTNRWSPGPGVDSPVPVFGPGPVCLAPRLPDQDHFWLPPSSVDRCSVRLARRELASHHNRPLETEVEPVRRGFRLYVQGPVPEPRGRLGRPLSSLRGVFVGFPRKHKASESWALGSTASMA